MTTKYVEINVSAKQNTLFVAGSFIILMPIWPPNAKPWLMIEEERNEPDKHLTG